MKLPSHSYAIFFYSCLLLSSAGHAESLINPEISFVNPTRKPYAQVPADTTYSKKPVTVLVYGSARNDLMPFIDRNLTQLMQIGSNANITFLIHLDIFGPGRKKITRRFIVQKGSLLQVGDDMFMDSGDPATLIDACRWGFGNFPSETTVLILWNHGTGDLEPFQGRAINPSELFTYNPNNRMIELNRKIEFLDYVTTPQEKLSLRGICFDEGTGHFITNSQVGKALEFIKNTVLKGNPIDILCTDACLMQGIGFAYSLKPYHKAPVARYLIGSQEVVLATGYPYTHMFGKIAQQAMTPADFGTHTVQAFSNAYSRITNDYTQSAINLEKMDVIYEIVDNIAITLTNAMNNEQGASVRRLIQRCSSREQCTYFEEPTYKDLVHFCSNLIANISSARLINPLDTEMFKQHLTQQVNRLIQELQQVITANMVGGNLKQATGLSIYIPERKIDPSYATTDFAKNSSWFTMIKTYLNSK